MSPRPAITSLLLFAALAIAPGVAVADDVIVVPFAGDDAALASELAGATAAVLGWAPEVSARVAERSREDVLKAAACPGAAAECIGQLPASLDADRAISGSVSIAAGRIAIELRVIHRDGAVMAHAIEIAGGDRLAVIERYEAALAEKLGVVPPPEPAAIETRPAPSEPAITPPGSTAPGPLATASAPPADHADPEIRPATWAVLGLGGFGAVLGTAFLIKADRTEQAIQRAPTETDEDLRALRALEDRGDTEKTTGVVILMIGSAAVIGGATMLAMDLARQRDVGIAVGPASGGWAVTARGRF